MKPEKKATVGESSKRLVLSLTLKHNKELTKHMVQGANPKASNLLPGTPRSPIQFRCRAQQELQVSVDRAHYLMVDKKYIYVH